MELEKIEKDKDLNEDAVTLMVELASHCIAVCTGKPAEDWFPKLYENQHKFGIRISEAQIVTESLAMCAVTDSGKAKAQSE